MYTGFNNFFTFLDHSVYSYLSDVSKYFVHLEFITKWSWLHCSNYSGWWFSDKEQLFRHTGSWEILDM